jgi:hypothetical protein
MQTWLNSLLFLRHLKWTNYYMIYGLSDLLLKFEGYVAVAPYLL